jgi:uncharacterized membrane protein YdjX (TVP38/TMEM64 family)
MKKILIRLIILAGILGIVSLVFRYTPLGEWVNLSRIGEQKDSLLFLVKEHYAGFVFAFILVYIAVVALSIPGATILSLSGGFFFGPWLGTLYINLGANLGAFLIFLIARQILGNKIQEQYAEQLERFNRDMKANGSNYLLSLRLIPVFPFFLINLLAGVSAVRPRTFLWTTSLGILPGSFVYAWLGHAGASLSPGETRFPTEALIALILLGFSSLIPVLIRRRKGVKQ